MRRISSLGNNKHREKMGENAQKFALSTYSISNINKFIDSIEQNWAVSMLNLHKTKDCEMVLHLKSLSRIKSLLTWHISCINSTQYEWFFWKWKRNLIDPKKLSWIQKLVCSKQTDSIWQIWCHFLSVWLITFKRTYSISR